MEQLNIFKVYTILILFQRILASEIILNIGKFYLKRGKLVLEFISKNSVSYFFLKLNNYLLYMLPTIHSILSVCSFQIRWNLQRKYRRRICVQLHRRNNKPKL